MALFGEELTRKVTARAYPNIALVKYWGKRDVVANLPYRDSLAVVLDSYATRVTVERRPRGSVEVISRGRPWSPEHAIPVQRLVALALGDEGFRVEVDFGLSPAVGFAQSAATYAALPSRWANL